MPTKAGLTAKDMNPHILLKYEPPYYNLYLHIYKPYIIKTFCVLMNLLENHHIRASRHLIDVFL
jgi:hypothetical protein